MGDGYAHTQPPPPLANTRIHTDVHSYEHTHTHTQAHTHAQTLTVMGHGAVYAHIKRKSLISVTRRPLAPKELANSLQKHIHNVSGIF